MKPYLLLLAAILPLSAPAQQPALTQANIQSILGFEGDPAPLGLPLGWYTPGPPLVTADTSIVHGGQRSVRIQRTPQSPNAFTSISARVPVGFSGKTVQLRGYLRVDNVQGNAALWLREDDADGVVLSIQNGDPEHFTGTADWKQFSLTLPLRDDARALVFGAYLQGTGTAWVDDLELLVDNQPLALAPPAAQTILDTDTEFAAGSHLHIDTLTDAQVENLATLGELWGFLKYHHPAVTAGQRNWDFALFRILPAILSARTTAERNQRLLQWVDTLGTVPPCNPCVKLDPTGLQSSPDIAWLSDQKRLGPALSQRLRQIYDRRPQGKDFFVQPKSGNGNPIFTHEPTYAKLAFPDPGFQLLLLFRWWNAVEWWSPNRYLGPDWHTILRRYVRPLITATDKHQFILETFKLIGEARDTHANLWSSLDQRPPTGTCSVPASIRFLGDQAVVWHIGDPASTLRLGDIIQSIDRQPVSDLIRQWTPFYADSNDAARKRDIAGQMTNGPCGPTTLGILRDGKPIDVTEQRQKKSTPLWHDQPGETFRLLSKDIAYLKLSTIHAADIPDYIQRAAGTRGMIIDLRNYPSDFVPFALGQYLVDKPTAFVHFTVLDLANPGAFHFKPSPPLQPGTSHYTGRIAILVDEQTLSQAEYTTMAFHSVPGALLIGSQTAGADGDVSNIPLPFGLSTLISGLGVFTPIYGQTQRIGLARDIESVPTVAGIAAGRDELLETAIRAVTQP